MAYRNKMKSKSSKKYFSKYAQKTNGKNIRALPMRGGFRI